MSIIKVLQMPIRNAKGGITQYALRNWEYIDKKRYQFDWVTLDKELSFKPELTRQGCKVHHLSCRQEDNEAQFRVEMESILARGYDAIHLHTSYWRGFLAEELAIAANLPGIIVHAHSTGIDISDPVERAKRSEAHRMWKEKFSMELATHFAACSTPAAEFLFGTQIHKERIIILKNAIDTTRFAYNEKTRTCVRSQLGLSDLLVILQPARLEYQKNHSFMLGAFSEVIKSLPGSVLLLAGDGSLRDTLEKETSELGIAGKVRFLGYREDIPELLQAADILVMPSLFEGLTIAAIEAQCSGVYCLLSEHMADETVITSNAVRLPLDKALWRDEIVRLARDGYKRCDRSADVAVAERSQRL